MKHNQNGEVTQIVCHPLITVRPLFTSGCPNAHILFICCSKKFICTKLLKDWKIAYCPFWEYFPVKERPTNSTPKKKEWTTDTYHSTDESQKHYAEKENKWVQTVGFQLYTRGGVRIFWGTRELVEVIEIFCIFIWLFCSLCICQNSTNYL